MDDDERRRPPSAERRDPVGGRKPLALQLDEPGTLQPPGPIGRLVRLAWGMLLVVAAGSIWTGRAALVGWSTPADPLWWLGVVLLLSAFPYVVNIGFGIDGRAWPRRLVMLGMAAGVGANIALFDALWSPALGWAVIGWQLYTLVHLGGSFVLAAIIATPGCEMRAPSHLWALLTGRPANEHRCPGHIDSVDRWERRRWGALAGPPRAADAGSPRRRS